MAIKKVIIHAGLYKTGSTSIQETLYKNKDLLEANGYIIVSDFPRNQGRVLRNLFSKTPDINWWANVTYGMDANKILADNEKTHAVLSDIINTKNGILVLSGEGLSIINEEYDSSCIKDYFNKYFKNVEIQVIICVRNPVNMMVSAYQEKLIALQHKGVFAQGDMFLKEVFIKRLKGFIEEFGDNARIYKFEDALKHPCGLVAYFLQEIGIPEAEIPKFDFVKANESRCAEVVELLLEIHKKLPGIIKKNNARRVSPLRERGDIYCLRQIPGVKFDRSYEKKFKQRQLAEDDVLWLKQTTGIDYTEYPSPPAYEEAILLTNYGPETIEGFINAFPELSLPLKTIFLDFFRRKHQEIGDDKFLALYAEDSAPYKDYVRSINDMYAQLSKLKRQKINWEKREENLKLRLQRLQNDLNNQKQKHKEIYVQYTSLQSDLDEQKKRHEELSAMYASLLNSTSWKITDPLRKMVNFCRKQIGKIKE